jgi:Fuc2NAc and GlcNAc transferase
MFSLPPVPAWLIITAAFVGAWLMTLAVRRYALRSDLIDRPNERSSHVVPTPRGGGVAIVLAFLAGTATLAGLSLVPVRFAGAVLGAGALVAILGFTDDRKPLPARYRFAGHVAAAAWVSWWIGALPPVPVFGFDVPLGLAGAVLGVLFIVWSINLFNFMDGIDGIASIEAITVMLGGAWVWWLAGNSGQWQAAVLLAACTAGFLAWNYPPARIFMGDAGSGFLGLMVAAFALWCGSETPRLFWAWLVLYGVFMVDATTTLVRRVRRGERFYEAHRSHAYQYASRKHGSHERVSLGVGLINVLWLLPMASLIAIGWLDGLLGVLVAYAPLVGLAFRYKAGDRRAQAAARA